MATLPGGMYGETHTGTDAGDAINGGNGSDFVSGLGGDDALFGGNGKDGVSGDADNDYVVGGNAKDVLSGGSGDDYLNGGNGADYLDGGSGDDQLVGGQGGDTFVFTGGGGQDLVMDFQKGLDTLQIARNINGLDIASADDLAARVTSVDGKAVIDLGNGDSITLQGVSAADVQADPDAFFTVV